VREYLERHFDVPQLITHWAIRNFAGVWDDGSHNFYLYKRASDGKYEALPQDFDLEFGGNGRSPTASIFMGEEGAGEDPVGGINWLKSAVIKAFRNELRVRFVELLGTVLSEKNVLEQLDQALAGWDQKAWDESPAMGKCDASARVANARAWLATRYAYLAQQGLR
jgi:spore coat protein CotH